MFCNYQGGGRLRAANTSPPPSDPGTMTRVIATHPPVELVEQRDDHTRVWEIVKEVETTHPDGSTSVDTLKSYIHEKGSGLCYKDASGDYLPAVAEWRETPDGFVIDRCIYTLRVGKRLEGPMSYTVKGRELLLRPSYLMASDGANEVVLGLPDPDVIGLLDFESPSTLRFPAAFGPGLDIEIVAEKSGFHQNLIISERLGLPRGFDAAWTRLYLYTSINATDYISDPTCWARFGAEPIDLGAGGVLTPASDVDAIVMGGLREGADGTFCDGPILSFEVSPVYDSAAPRIPDLLAERQLMRDEASGELFLIESIPFRSLEDASLPLVLDYVPVSGSLEGEHTWQTGTTYFVSSNLYVSGSGKLTIQHGVFVKLNCNTSIIVQDSLEDEWGKVAAVGTDTDYIRFTSADDDDWGDYISRPPAVAGSYNTALYLAGGSSTQSEIEYCMFRKGGIAVWDFQEIAEPISNNVISQMDYQGIGIWFYGLSGAGGLHNNLITGCSMVGVALTYATVPGITNNTIDDCERGINAWNSSCSSVEDNILSRNTIGIKKEGSGSLTVDHNGYWDCTTPVAGEDMGSNSKVLSSSPYEVSGEFYLDQSCDLIDAGSQPALAAGLDEHTTCQYGDRDQSTVDIGFHYWSHVDLEANDLYGTLAPADELSPGAYLHYNIDDDNMNSSEPNEYDLEEDHSVTHEDDLEQLEILVDDSVTSGTVVLSRTNANVQVWKSAIKGYSNKILTGSAYQPDTEGNGKRTWDLSNPTQRQQFNSIKNSLYVEGRAEGTASLKAKYQKGEEIEVEDTINYTFIGATCGDQPAANRRNILQWCFPNLVGCEYSVTGPATEVYNCIAWSVKVSGDYVHFYEVDQFYGDYDQVYETQDFDDFYEAYGYTPTPYESLAEIFLYKDPSQAYKEEDIYHCTNPEGITHAARVKEDCDCGAGKWIMWESKCGSLERLEHRRYQLNGSGDAYGSPYRYYKKN